MMFIFLFYFAGDHEVYFICRELVFSKLFLGSIPVWLEAHNKIRTRDKLAKEVAPFDVLYVCGTSNSKMKCFPPHLLLDLSEPYCTMVPVSFRFFWVVPSHNAKRLPVIYALWMEVSLVRSLMWLALWLSQQSITVMNFSMIYVFSFSSAIECLRMDGLSISRDSEKTKGRRPITWFRKDREK